MKRRTALALIVGVLLLAGCKSLEDVADERDRCHEFGGVFSSWRDGLTGGSYVTECDLSDPEPSP